MYDFDKPINRQGTHCVKWDMAPHSAPEGATLASSAANNTIEAPSGAVGGAPLIPLWVADMDFEAAPAIRAALQKRVEHGVFGYAIVQDSYYDAVINWYERRHQWHIEREWIQYTTGVVPAISAVIKALTMPGERVLIMTPVYNCFFSSIRNNGCEVLESKLVPVSCAPTQEAASPTLTYEVDWDDFERKCADEKCTVFLLCNPHNPAGRVWTREELQRMNDICQRHHVRIISDEIHCELTMPGYEFVPFGRLAPQTPTPNPSPREGSLDTFPPDDATSKAIQTPLPLGEATGATGVFRAATGVAAAPPRGANPSFATEDFRAATGVAAAPQRGANPSFATEEQGGGSAGAGWVICCSPSKSFNTAGLQMANIICADAETRRRIDRAININEICDVNPFAPLAVEAAYNESEDWIDELNQYLWGNYQALLAFFAEQLPQLKVFKLEGTYLVWVDITALRVSADEIEEKLLREARVWVNSGTMYGADGYIRINIATQRARLMEGLKRMAAVLAPSHRGLGVSSSPLT